MDERSNNSWEYVDFELEIREGGPREYPVFARASGDRRAAGRVFLPFDKLELENKLRALRTALIASSVKRRGGSPEEQQVKEFGRSLFETLLTGKVGLCYEASLSEAKHQNKGLRLKLRLPPELTVLPWEFLYDPERENYLCLSRKTPLVRYLDLREPGKRLPVTSPLNILCMAASPEGLPPLDVEHEKRLLEEATRELRAAGKVRLKWLGDTWRDLNREMRNGPWHMFHFVGHGGFDPTNEEGAIALSNDEGRKYLLSASKLARLLDDHYYLRLVFLNSCEGARGNDRDTFSSTAATLVRSGVPAVVAMQYEITDKAAIQFSRNFYEAVADGLPVDASVAEARRAVSMDDTLEWGTPVLYMRSPDGRVFDLQEDDISGAAQNPEDQYRSGVEAVWADEALTEAEALWLDGRRSILGLSQSAAARIEREVMGAAKEELVRGSAPPVDPLWQRVLAWFTPKKAGLLAVPLVLIALLLAYFTIFNDANTEAAIEEQVRGHYEAIRKGDMEAAFEYFSGSMQVNAGGEELWIKGYEKCPVQDNSVRDVDVWGVNGDTANVSMTYEAKNTCGVVQRWGFIWAVVKQDGEWKLNQQVQDTVLYSSEPIPVDNGGETKSDVSGKTEQENLKWVRSSNTAEADDESAENEQSYEPGKAVDGKTGGEEGTAWVVGGEGTDEWILLEYDKPIKVRSVGIIPGFDRMVPGTDFDMFYRGRVLKEAFIELNPPDNEKSERLDLSEPLDFDREKEMRYADFDDIEATSIRITIRDTYEPGDNPETGDSYPSTYNQAGISEIEVKQP